MKNDKQIAFTELSFQPFSGKFVTCNYRVSQTNFVECLNPHFLRRIFYPWPNL